MEVSGRLHAPAALLPVKDRIRGWVGLGTGLDEVEKTKILPLPEIESRPSGS
jgi:hypothetical protein